MDGRHIFRKLRLRTRFHGVARLTTIIRSEFAQLCTACTSQPFSMCSHGARDLNDTMELPERSST